MTKAQAQNLIEARHLLRKHVIKSRVAGRAVTFKCKECGAVGADVSTNIMHLESCRFANLLEMMGEKITTIPSAAASQKSSPVTIGTVSHDPVAAALECSS